MDKTLSELGTEHDGKLVESHKNVTVKRIKRIGTNPSSAIAAAIVWNNGCFSNAVLESLSDSLKTKGMVDAISQTDTRPVETQPRDPIEDS